MTTQKEKIELAKLLEEKERRQRYNKIDTLFPPSGPYRRDLYPKHMDFIKAGSEFPHRAFIAANRTGKTTVAAYELTCHLTGIYPTWWNGARFEDHISAWAASVSNSDTRDIMQKELLGDYNDMGSGMIPKHLIVDTVAKAGVPRALEKVYVKNVDGQISELGFKSYEQSAAAFQGTMKQAIWLDEEPKDHDIFTECLTRLSGGSSSRDGLIMLSFTPLFGLSDVAMSFLPDGVFPPDGRHPNNPYAHVTQVSWEEVPHLSDAYKKSTLASMRPHEIEARTKGIPALGSGAIYPVAESVYVCDPIQVQPWMKVAFGMDFGWTNLTAIVWGAKDPSTGVITVYSEHGLAKTTPPIHAAAIKARGDWITGACDPAGFANQGAHGISYVGEYESLGIYLVASPGGPNSKEARISRVLTMLESGMLKIASNCVGTIQEMRTYRRDKKGDIVKNNDHFMDALQYLICEFDNISQEMPDDDDLPSAEPHDTGRCPLTGY